LSPGPDVLSDDGGGGVVGDRMLSQRPWPARLVMMMVVVVVV